MNIELHERRSILSLDYKLQVETQTANYDQNKAQVTILAEQTN